MTPRRLITAVTVALFVAAVFAVLASGVLPYRLYVVHTGSMSPTFDSTSAVLVRTGDYRVGQPISFLANGEVVTHRLLSIDAQGEIVTQGDANATPDPWHLTTGSIIGGVVGSLPHLGYWLQFLKNPFGLLAILAAAAVCWQLWTFADPAPGGPALRSKHRVDAPRHARGRGYAASTSADAMIVSSNGVPAEVAVGATRAPRAPRPPRRLRQWAS